MGVVPAWLAWPVKVSCSAGLTDDGIDDAEGMIFAFEHGALLDVELEVAEGGVVDDGCGEFVGIEAEVADGFGDGDAVAVGAREGCRRRARRRGRGCRGRAC